MGRLACRLHRFLSTPSARRATVTQAIRGQWPTYFYPRPPRGGRLVRFNKRLRKKQISIHALREEGDPQTTRKPKRKVDFYPRPPRGGRPIMGSGQGAKKKFLSTPSARRATHSTHTLVFVHKFLSTPSARRATRAADTYRRQYHDFYPRPPRGGRRKDGAITGFDDFISIHALREEGDVAGADSRRHFWNFYPRPPRGGRRGVNREQNLQD